MTRQVERSQERVGRAVAGLQLVSPLAILARGYSVVEHDTHILTTVDDVAVGDTVHIRLATGELEATVTAKESEK